MVQRERVPVGVLEERLQADAWNRACPLSARLEFAACALEVIHAQRDRVVVGPELEPSDADASRARVRLPVSSARGREGRHWGRAQEAAANSRGEGDIGVLNGRRGTVTALEPDTFSLRVEIDGHGERVLPGSYIEEGHVGLGYAYAMTVHKSQGMTADRTYVLGSEDHYRELGYTALSRHRDECRFYVNAGEPAAGQLELEIAGETPRRGPGPHRTRAGPRTRTADGPRRPRNRPGATRPARH